MEPCFIYIVPLWIPILILSFVAITQAAKITKEIQTNRVKDGADAEFVAKFAGNPRPEITWWYNGVQMAETDKIKIRVEGDSAILSLLACTLEMEGMYECRIQNKLASGKTKALLAVSSE